MRLSGAMASGKTLLLEIADHEPFHHPSPPG